MSRILVPYDGSEQSEKALEYTLNEFRSDEVILLHVIRPFESQVPVPGLSEEWQESAEQRAEELFNEARKIAEESDAVLSDTVIKKGHPKRVIVSYAEEHDINHVVMGSHGRSGVSRVLLGSIAETVVRRAPVPVTIVR